MKFAIDKDIFLSGLQKQQGIAPAKAMLPIIQNVLLETTDDGHLNVWATDLDISLRCRLVCEVEEQGKITLPVRRIVGIVRESDSGMIHIESESNGMVKVKAGTSRFKILGLPADDFPPIPKSEGEPAIVLPQGTLKEMLKKTGYAASEDNTRHVLNGVLLERKEGKLTSVATDGRRLSIVEHEAVINADKDFSVILPSKSVNEVMKLLGEKTEVSIYVRNGHAIFDFGNEVLGSRLVDGAYPNYRQVIPACPSNKAIVCREDMIAVLKRVSVMTTQQSDSLKLSFEDNKLTVSVNSPDVGEGKDCMDISYTGAAINTCFKGEYLLEMLKNDDIDKITIGLENDGLSPILVDGGNNAAYVVMPLRIS